jgi:regulatory protein
MRPAKRISAAEPVGGVVTSLAGKRGANERVVVYLDGARAFEVASEVALACDLRQGVELSPEAVGSLLADDAPYRARERALKLIALRDRTAHELESHLERAGFAADVSEGAVSWLRALGYVDDAAFATRYSAAKLKSGWGERRVASELLRLGVDRGLVQAALQEARVGAPGQEGEEPGLDAVLDLARRRFGTQFGADPEAAARRLAGFLARRGFDWDTIHAVARILQREAADADCESGNKQPFS